MAVDLMHFPKIDDQMAIQEAASQGLQSMEHLIRVLSNHTEQQNVDCSEITDFTVTKFKKVISLLNRTGHARFRRGPVQSFPSFPHQTLKLAPPQAQNVPPSCFVHLSKPSVTLDFTKPRNLGAKAKTSELENFTVSLNSSYLSSTLSGDDGSVSNGKGSSVFITSAPSRDSRLVVSSGKPPLASYPYRKRCLEHEQSKSLSVKNSGSGKCHCKKRKNTMKRTVRVPAISSKIADIPSDEYAWRKYGQKPIKGSPHPRGYYRCSTFKDCSARKHVERALDDPAMLIVTYEGEHLHNKSATSRNIASTGVNNSVFG